MKVLEESEQPERIDTSCFFLFTLHLSPPPFFAPRSRARKNDFSPAATHHLRFLIFAVRSTRG